MEWTMESSFLSFSPKIQSKKKPKLTITGPRTLVFGLRRKRKSCTSQNSSLMSRNTERREKTGANIDTNKENEEPNSTIIIDETDSSSGSMPEHILDTIVLESSSDECSYDCVTKVTKKYGKNENATTKNILGKKHSTLIDIEKSSTGSVSAVSGDKTNDIETWLDDLHNAFKTRALSSLNSFHNEKDLSFDKAKNVSEQKSTSTEKEDSEEELFKPKISRRAIIISDSESDSSKIGTHSKKRGKSREKPSSGHGTSSRRSSDKSDVSLASVTSQEKILNDLYGGLWDKQVLTPATNVKKYDKKQKAEQTIGSNLKERTISSEDSASFSDVSQTSVQNLLSDIYEEELNWKQVLTPIHKNKTKDVNSKGRGTHVLGGKNIRKLHLPSAPKNGIPIPSKDATVRTSPKYFTFLKSLSASPPLSQCDPKALIYKRNFSKHKETLCSELYRLFNRSVFDNKLPVNMRIDWNVRMNRTAGFCYNRWVTENGTKVRSARIELATKVLTSADRVRDTLIHELCHAATWVINGVRNGHGAVWKSWARKAMLKFPELPLIGRCHSYKIQTKYTYTCKRCGYSIGRHSKSLDLKLKRCGYCLGEFELLVNTKNGKSDHTSAPTTRAPRAATGFALYVKENYKVLRQTKKDLKHSEIMKLLGNQFAELKVGDKVQDCTA